MSFESSSLVDTETVAVQPPPTTTVSSYIAPTETQKTAGEEPATTVLPLPTKTGRGWRVAPTWRLVIICVGLSLSL